MLSTQSAFGSISASIYEEQVADGYLDLPKSLPWPLLRALNNPGCHFKHWAPPVFSTSSLGQFQWSCL